METQQSSFKLTKCRENWYPCFMAVGCGKGRNLTLFQLWQMVATTWAWFFRKFLPLKKELFLPSVAICLLIRGHLIVGFSLCCCRVFTSQYKQLLGDCCGNWWCCGESAGERDRLATDAWILEGVSNVCRCRTILRPPGNVPVLLIASLPQIHTNFT